MSLCHCLGASPPNKYDWIIGVKVQDEFPEPVIASDFGHDGGLMVLCAVYVLILLLSWVNRLYKVILKATIVIMITAIIMIVNSNGNTSSSNDTKLIKVINISVITYLNTNILN